MAHRVLMVLGRVAFALMLLAISPLVLLWLMLDFRRLRRVAMELEPLDVDERPILYCNRLNHAIDWFLRAFIAPVLMFVALPLIALLGLFMWVLLGDDDDQGG